MKLPGVEVPDIETFGSNKDRKIRVWTTPQFNACCEVVARLDIPTDAAWKMLTHEDNHKIFRDLKRTNPRKYKKRGVFETVYEVEHITGWSLLWLSGEFVTKLLVKENRGSKSVSFKLLKSDIMNDFDGSWTLQPCTQAGLNRLYGKGNNNPFDGIIGLFGGRHAKASLMEFEQKVEPKSAPRPLKPLIRRIAAGGLQKTMDDLAAESKRIKQGKATLPGFEQWAEIPAKPPKDTPKKAAVEAGPKPGSLTLSHGDLWRAVADGPLVGRMQALALW